MADLTDAQLVRLLISDTDTEDQLFTDDEIAGFLALEGSVKRAAAQALDVIASNEAMVSKVIRTQDLATDGSKTAAALRAHATELRAQADISDADDDVNFHFEVIDPAPPCPPERAWRTWPV